MNELCECQVVATRICPGCDKVPLCKECYGKLGCKACLAKFATSTDESDEAQFEAWLKEQEHQ